MGLLDGKVVLVTGAARGIGEACAELAAREGARVPFDPAHCCLTLSTVIE